MQCIYKYIPQTNHISGVTSSFAGILDLQINDSFIIPIINIILLPQTSYVSKYRPSFATILWSQQMVQLMVFPILNISYFHITKFSNNCAVSSKAAVCTSTISSFQVCCSGIFLIFLRLFQLTLLLLESIIFKLHISCNPTVNSSHNKTFRLLS